MQHSLGISGRVQTAAELCHRMVDFCQRLTTAKRKILEDPDLYPEVVIFCLFFFLEDHFMLSLSLFVAYKACPTRQ